MEGRFEVGGGFFEGGVEFFGVGGALGVDHQVDHRNGAGWDAVGHAVELAVEVGEDESDGLGGASGRRDDVHRSGAGAAEVAMDGIEDRLVVGVGVDRGHDPALDADGVVEHLGHRCEAVGGAGGVGDDVVRGRVVSVVVDAEHDGQVFVLGRGGDDDLGGTVVQVSAGPVGVGEDAGGFDDDFDAVVAPGNLSGVALGDHGDALTVDHEVAVDDINLARVAAVVGVVLEEMGVGVGVGEVVDRDDFEVIAVEVEHALEHLPPDAAEAVDADFGRHEGLLSVWWRMSSLAGSQSIAVRSSIE